ncbi:MAG: thiamine phosphate synthase, partial [Edaphobacter sp.]
MPNLPQQHQRPASPTALICTQKPPIPYTYTVLRYAITNRTLLQPDREGWDPKLSTLIRQTTGWAAAGIDYIQLREKDLPAAILANLARRILEKLHGTPTKLLINSRSDVAIAIRAHGVHLTAAAGQLTPPQIRQLYAAAHLPAPVISISCHTLPEVEQARSDNPDIILYGPVFQKSIADLLISPGQGLEALHCACLAAAPIPIYALGGVTPENTPACL